MQLVINTYGSYLKRSGECFMVKTEEKAVEVSARKVDSILIATSAYLTTDALLLAIENNIDVVFLNDFGDPFARVWHSKLGSTVLIRRRQLEVSTTEAGFEMARQWVLRKFDNQLDFLGRLKRPREDKASQVEQYMSRISGLKHTLGSLSGVVDEKRNVAMALEGAAGRAYFEALSYVMPERFKFDGRSRNPAKDEFNALLNYGYGILYSLVEKACIIAGLDPYIGFLHADNYNKQSLVFDLIEMFRIYAEEPVVFLFSGRKVKVEYFDQVKGGLRLNKEGKALLIEAMTRNLDDTVRYRGRNIQKRNIIQFECHAIANKLIKEERKVPLPAENRAG
jgi:CRISPR-associated protein Cas1